MERWLNAELNASETARALADAERKMKDGR
jgi:hypothetical protein